MRHQDQPSEGDMLTLITSTDATPSPLPYLVIRVNFPTGRGTVQHIETGKKLQIVRGRFDTWRLADGTSCPVRFIDSWCQIQDGQAGVGHETPLVGDILNPVLPNGQRPEDHTWAVTDVNDTGTWVTVRRLDDRSQVQMIFADSAGCWRFEDGRRIWFVTTAGRLLHRTPLASDKITVTGRIVTDSSPVGKVVSCILRKNGHMIGTMWKMRGKWSSAYEQDGQHNTRGALIESMLSERSRALRSEGEARLRRSRRAA